MALGLRDPTRDVWVVGPMRETYRSRDPRVKLIGQGTQRVDPRVTSSTRTLLSRVKLIGRGTQRVDPRVTSSTRTLLSRVKLIGRGTHA